MRLASIVVSIAPAAFSPQAIGTIVNAFTKFAADDKEGFMSLTATDKASNMAIARDVRGCVPEAEAVLEHMAHAVAGTAPQTLDWQAISNIMNGFAQLGHRPRSRLCCLSLCMYVCMHAHACMHACIH